MNAKRKSPVASSPMKWLAMGVAAVGLGLFLSVTAQAGNDKKDHDKKDHSKKDHDKKDHDKKDKDDKHKKQDERKKFNDEVVRLLKDQVARDAADLAAANGQLARDSLPLEVGGRPDRIAADQLQVARSAEKLAKDQSLLKLAEARSDKDKGKDKK